LVALSDTVTLKRASIIMRGALASVNNLNVGIGGLFRVGADGLTRPGSAGNYSFTSVTIFDTGVINAIESLRTRFLVSGVLTVYNGGSFDFLNIPKPAMSDSNVLIDDVAPRTGSTCVWVNNKCGCQTSPIPVLNSNTGCPLGPQAYYNHGPQCYNITTPY